MKEKKKRYKQKVTSLEKDRSLAPHLVGKNLARLAHFLIQNSPVALADSRLGRYLAQLCDRLLTEREGEWNNAVLALHLTHTKAATKSPYAVL
mgnify:CR=1 FL=1